MGLQGGIAEAPKIAAITAMLEVICRSTGMGFAAVVALSEGEWRICAARDEIGIGLEPGAIFTGGDVVCGEALRRGAPIAIEHLALDPAWSHRLPPASHRYQSYLAAPIAGLGSDWIGALCAADPCTIPVSTPQITGMFRLFAELAAFHLCPPANQGAISHGNDRYLALLGHELRNPLATINMSAWLASRTALPDKAAAAVEAIRGSVVRMSGLIDDLLDLAANRVDGAMLLQRDADEPLEPALRAVISECRGNWPGRPIEAEFSLASPIDCDRGRIAHLLAILLRLVLNYGAAAQPVRIRAAGGGRRFELSVFSAGGQIPAELQARLLPEEALAPGKGLELGIAATIARAHGGALTLDLAGGGAGFNFSFQGG